MKTLTKGLFSALIATTLLSACSRPYATFQKTTPDHFYTKATPATPPVETSVAQSPVTVVTSAPATAETAMAGVTPAVAPVTVAAVQTKVNEFLAANKTELAADKKLAVRMNRVQTMLAAAAKPALTDGKAATKMNLMAKLVTRHIDKQISKKLAPEAPQTKSAIRLGIIVGVIGLLFLIIGGGFFGTLGAIALIIGVLGIVLGYLDVL